LSKRNVKTGLQKSGEKQTGCDLRGVTAHPANLPFLSFSFAVKGLNWILAL
jgi:hypothetical protein